MEYTLLFQRKKIRDFAGPLGDTHKVTLRKSCLAPAEKCLSVIILDTVALYCFRKEVLWAIHAAKFQTATGDRSDKEQVH